MADFPAMTWVGEDLTYVKVIMVGDGACLEDRTNLSYSRDHCVLKTSLPTSQGLLLF